MSWVGLMVMTAAALPPTGEPPAWVEPVAIPAPELRTTEPIVMLLDDTQIRAGAKPREWFEHRAWKVLTVSGIEQVAQQEFVWEPTYEKLTLHGAWIWRDGKRHVAWDPEDARVLQRESGLDQGIYDGRQTLILELRDIRVGDIVEIASTVTGENPVFEGHISFSHFSHTSEPLALSRLRVLWEGKRPLQVKTHGGAKLPDSTTADGVTTFRLEQKDLLPIRYESDVPDDLPQTPWVTFSDWASWEEVAAWGARTFSVQPSSAPRFNAELERLRKLPEAERLEAIVRFVQDDVRYVGVELGTHSHRPHAVEWVLERGFGDCKDKAQLLVALLRGAGLQAWPVLVNSSHGGLLPQTLASPNAFDHAIVKLLLPDGPRFIDATTTLQRGKVAKFSAPTFRWGLTIDEKTTALEKLPAANLDEPTWELRQTWNAARLRGEPTLEVVITGRGADASRLRRLVVNDQFKEERRKEREHDFKTKLELVDMQLSDDEGAEAVSLIENYKVKGFWDLDEHEFQSVMLGWHLTLPSEDRTLPFELEYPLRMKETVVWNSAEQLKPSNFHLRNMSYDHPAFALRLVEQVQGTQLRVDWELLHHKDRVTSEELQTYRETTTRALDGLSFGVSKSRRSYQDSAGPREPLGLTGWACLGVGLVVGLLILNAPRIPEWFGAGKAKWRTSRFLAKQRGARGELANNPATVSSLDEGRALFSSRACPRGHAGWSEIVSGGGVRLGDDRIEVLTRKCTTCDAREDRYVKVTS